MGATLNNTEINRREADRWTVQVNVHYHDLYMKCLTPCFTVILLILLFSTSLSACPSHPCYISLPELPLNGKQLGRGLPRAHYAQIFNEFPSTSPLSPSLSSVLPCSLPSFKVGLCSWNKRKTACMRTSFSPTYGTLFLSSFLWICFPTLLPGDTLVLWLVLLLTSWKILRYNAAELYCQECIYLSNVSELLLCPDTQPCSPAVVDME